FLHVLRHLSVLHSFPTRRSSDLETSKGPSASWAGTRRSRSSAPTWPEPAVRRAPPSGPAARARWPRACEFERKGRFSGRPSPSRSEEHTSELQSRFDLVCRLLLE